MSAAADRAGARMFTTTFYSYKGGVGRSVALLNTANQLALRGRSVVMLDFDLEAPGLHSAVTKVWSDARGALRRPGMVDYFTEFKAAAASGGEAEPPELKNYLSRGFGPGKGIRLITAGDLTDFSRYALRLAQLNIVDFAERWYGRELLLELRADIAASGCDYLLVDSRTGHTDALGATTVLLPDAVALLTNLSEQSVDGTRRTLDLIQLHGTHEGRASPAGAQLPNLLCARDTDDPDIETLTVASPIPFGDQTGLRRAAEVLGRPVDHVVYHVPRIAAHESEHVIPDATGGRRSRSSEVDPAFVMYSELTDRIEALNPYEPRALAQLGLESLSRQDWRVALGYFRSAESFLRGSEDTRESPADQVLQIRLWLGKARALALGFQTAPAAGLIDAASGKIDAMRAGGLEVEHLMADLIVARLQLVRGQFGSDELLAAVAPARAARSTANLLRDEAGRPDPWELSTGLMSAEASILGGDYSAAAEEAGQLPRMARRLNRRVEMVRALQLRAQALLNAGHIAHARSEAEGAVKEADLFGVDYLAAEAYLTAAQVEIAAGATSDERRERLEQAARTFVAMGDGFGSANCQSELGMYLHRLGEREDLVREALVRSLEGYQRISGTSLGQITTLLYATRALLDRGTICREVPSDVPMEAMKRRRGQSDSDLPPLTRPSIARELPRAVDTLVLAAFIAAESGVDLLSDLIAAYWLEAVRFADPKWLAYAATELGVEGPPPLNPDRDRRQPSIDLEVQRSVLLDRMLGRSAGDEGVIGELRALATEAELAEASYNEACTRALCALAFAAAGRTAERDEELSRLQELQSGDSLRWTVWGQVRAVRDTLRNGAAAAWRQPAAAVLAAAAARGLPTEP